MSFDPANPCEYRAAAVIRPRTFAELRAAVAELRTLGLRSHDIATLTGLDPAVIERLIGEVPGG